MVDIKPCCLGKSKLVPPSILCSTAHGAQRLRLQLFRCPAGGWCGENPCRWCLEHGNIQKKTLWPASDPFWVRFGLFWIMVYHVYPSSAPKTNPLNVPRVSLLQVLQPVFSPSQHLTNLPLRKSRDTCNTCKHFLTLLSTQRPRPCPPPAPACAGRGLSPTTTRLSRKILSSFCFSGTVLPAQSSLAVQ